MFRLVWMSFLRTFLFKKFVDVDVAKLAEEVFNKCVCLVIDDWRIADELSMVGSSLLESLDYL